MQKQHYGLRTEVNLSYEEAVEKVTELLKEQGFGVLTEIDVKATLKKKLDVDTKPYIILGACNPPLAHKALQVETELGLFLPCNVIVYRDEASDKTVVSAIDPTLMFNMIDNPALDDIACDVRDRLQVIIEKLSE